MTKKRATAKKPKAKKSPKVKLPHGRPTKRTPQVEELILAGLRSGAMLAPTCRLVGVNPSTVWDWAQADPGFSQRLARAREDGELVIEAEIRAIADTPHLGYLDKQELRRTGEQNEDGTDKVALVTTERRVVDLIEHRKLQIDTRLKLLRVSNPGRYSDKVEVNATVTLEQLVAESMKSGVGP